MKRSQKDQWYFGDRVFSESNVQGFLLCILMFSWKLINELMSIVVFLKLDL